MALLGARHNEEIIWITVFSVMAVILSLFWVFKFNDSIIRKDILKKASLVARRKTQPTYNPLFNKEEENLRKKLPTKK